MIKGLHVEETRRMAEALTRGHKKRARTLEDLLDAAARVFSRKDAILTTFLEIANEARVASGTVHNYFKNKDELIEAASAKLVDRVNGPVGQKCQKIDDTAERLAIVIKTALQMTAEDPDWGAAMLRLVSATHRTTEKLTNLIPEILEEGRRTQRLAYRDTAAAQSMVGGAVMAGMRSVSDGAGHAAMGEHLSEHVLLALGLKPAEAAKVAKRAVAASC
jgi:AcrR family transcriptional regulator